ncbi:hypothetical protein VB780_00355 [Leptolyngbya sp. CCNP1308]|uniref:hypothetical protein n=1 Tax=Leptolyngbya sp. CCNP1308 TaxID=3110255 RepID=UPI002B21D304|nr:hypothetical protein [Leptolyngbya sp. CCNP1308]MEA5447000.1 hypothetical protein [Leptolyngbya sp. CCNP1308]
MKPQKSKISNLSSLFLSILIFVFLPVLLDKSLDLLVGIVGNRNITLKEFFYLILVIAVPVFVFAALLYTIASLPDLLKRLGKLKTIEEWQTQLENSRQDIFNVVQNLRLNLAEFYYGVDSIAVEVDKLEIFDQDFDRKKMAAIRNVLHLKESYKSNINELESLVERLYMDIDAAEAIFLGKESWAHDSADEFYED